MISKFETNSLDLDTKLNQDFENYARKLLYPDSNN